MITSRRLSGSYVASKGFRREPFLTGAISLPFLEQNCLGSDSPAPSGDAGARGVKLLSRTFTIIPSHLRSSDEWKKSWMVSTSSDVASRLLTHVKRCDISVNRLRRSSLRSRNGRESSSYISLASVRSRVRNGTHLAVQIHKIERKQTNINTDSSNIHVFSFSPS